MSADIWLLDKDGDRIIVDASPEAELADFYPQRVSAEVGRDGFNLTYNLSPMLWGAGMPRWPEFLGMPASDAGPIWEGVVDELKRDPDLYRTLDPENGWGNYDQAVEVLTGLYLACAKHPDATIGGWL